MQIRLLNRITVANLWNYPQLLAIGRFRTIGSTAGALQALLPPASSKDYECRIDAVPALGEHSDAILREIGRSDLDIATPRESGVV